VNDPLSPRDRVLKRAFDLLLSLAGLLALGWLIAIAYLLAAVDTRKSGFFIQTRVGRHGRMFGLVKIRTMKDHREIATSVTTSRDPRITPLGRLLRRTKIDELPQLWNVLVGDMSFVGPRPDVPGFADRLAGEDRVVLMVRPGITGPATLKYRGEEELLARQSDPERYNREVVFPDKTRWNRWYVENYSFRRDLALVWMTVTGRIWSPPDDE
jgi:lipopolysaccharide/colanic/teichoic acid biosynthesis glycosyltransferase